MLGLVNRHRQYLKSLTGFDQQVSERLLPLCVHAAQAKAPIIIHDTQHYHWYRLHSMVKSAPHIRFFASIPVVDMHGEFAATLCIIDLQPRTLSQLEINTLIILGRQCMLLLELGRQRHRLSALTAQHHEIKETERLRIARDLHDELGQSLLALKMELTTLLAPADAIIHQRIHQRINGVIHNLSGTIRGLRNIIHDLRPPVLELGLRAAIEWQIGKFEGISHIRCELETVDLSLTNNLSAEQGATLFRILQEALSNIRRHANAQRVRLQLLRTDTGIEMRISDDGIGILEHDLEKSQSYGLRGIRERLRSLHGKLLIESAPGLGTTLTVFLPLHE